MRKSIPPYKGKARNQWQMRKPIPTLVSTLLTRMGFYKGKACNQWQMRKPIPTIVSTLLTCMGFYKGKACNQWQMRKPIPTLVCINTLDPSGVLQRESTQPVADEKTHPYPCINTPDLHRVLQRESAQPEADKETHPYPYLHQHSWPAWVFRKGKRTASGRWGNPSLPLFVWILLTCVGFQERKANSQQQMRRPIPVLQSSCMGLWREAGNHWPESACGWAEGNQWLLRTLPPPPPLPPTTIDLHGLTNRQQATNGCWGPPPLPPTTLDLHGLTNGQQATNGCWGPLPPPPPPTHTHKSCPAWPYKRATGNQWQVRISPSSTPHPCTETSDLHDPATTNMANQGWLRSSLSSPTPPPVS